LTWNPGARSNASMVESCLANVAEAKARLVKLRQFYAEWPVGDPRRNGDERNPSLLERIRAAASDERHWQRELTWWRSRCVDQGDQAIATGAAIAEQFRPRKPQPRDPRLPREPGDDDEEECRG
jgi:hypothetical protein